MTGWAPRRFLRFVRSVGSSTQVAEIVTDQGPAFVKAMGNPEGPHALASDWVGTSLARLFGLQTFDFTLLVIDAPVDEIPFKSGGFAASGTAFCTRKEEGQPWGGACDELDALQNQMDIPRLVVFDTWIRNRDRHFPEHAVRKPNLDNVFLSSEGAETGKYRLIAMDHTHCFADTIQFGHSLASISLVRDDKIYGLFSEFMGYFNSDLLSRCLNELAKVGPSVVESIVRAIPHEWEVDGSTRIALCEFITCRAAFVAETMYERLRGMDGPWCNT